MSFNHKLFFGCVPRSGTTTVQAPQAFPGTLSKAKLTHLSRELKEKMRHSETRKGIYKSCLIFRSR